MNSINSGLIVYNMIFRPHFASRTNTNCIRELVKTYYDPTIETPSPKIYIVPKSKIQEYQKFLPRINYLKIDKSSMAYKNLRKDYNLKGWIVSVFTSNFYEYTDFIKYFDLVKPMKSQPPMFGENIDVKTDLFVVCKNEKDNTFSPLRQLKKDIKKRKKLYKKIEKSIIKKKGPTYYDRFLLYENHFMLTGPAREIKKLWLKAVKLNSLLQAMIPLPKNVFENIEANFKLVNEIWGTKYKVPPYENCLEVVDCEEYPIDERTIEDDSTEEASIKGYFISDWASPNKAFAKYIKKNKHITITNRYEKLISLPYDKGYFYGDNGRYSDKEYI